LRFKKVELIAKGRLASLCDF